MTRNTKQSIGAKSRNVQSGNMRNKAGSNYVHQKTMVPKKLKRVRDINVGESATPAQAELLTDIPFVQSAGAFSKRHRLVDPMAYAPLHNKLLAEIAARTKVDSVSKSMEHSKMV